MTDELVSYLLDDLDPVRRGEIERRLQADPAWQRELTRLQECLGTPQDMAPSADEPPRDLVRRTCCLVEQSGEHRALAAGPAAAAIASRGVLGGPSTWSMADVVVGGGVLAVLAMLLLPAVQETRDASRRIACQNNLMALGTGLYRYQQNHGHWLPPVAPGENAATYATALMEHVGYSRNQLASMLRCPGSSAAGEAQTSGVVAVPTSAELRSMFGPQRAAMFQAMANNYAYQVGYRDERGKYHYPKFTGSASVPMLADMPMITPAGASSGSHDGEGQNVLRQDLSVKFCTNCSADSGLDHLYLNHDQQHAAGCDKTDAMLMRGDFRPAGPPAEFPLSRPLAPLGVSASR